MLTEGFVVWFTGLPCAGKSTLARILRAELEQLGLRLELLDGDEVRSGLTRDLGFSKADRDENIRRIAFVAHLLARNGAVAIAAVISPYRAIRDQARQAIGRFVEVFAKCPIEVCIQRDVKGLYQRALAGEIQNFTGVSDPYEEPLAAEVVVETHVETPEAGVNSILAKLEELGYLPKPSGSFLVTIPGYLAQKVEAVLQRNRAQTLSNYVIDLIQRDLNENAEDAVGGDLRARVEARLRGLGYLD